MPDTAIEPTQQKEKGLKQTLNLPRTDFNMKANLSQNEPSRLAKWEAAGLYEQIRAARAGAEKYILHDGPPYANGAIHLGHALNKCIKDFVVKTKTMAGFDAPYVPGWDCHGLPIEIKVDEKLGGKKLQMDPVAVRQACREYAAKFVDLQRSQFKRLGILGRWDQPYATMDFPYEARILETFYAFYEKGFVYKGLKPVYWCSHDHTALAEAEVEYDMHVSPSVYVRYKLTSPPENIDPRIAGREVYTIIWTTTPWTLPASLAVAFGPEIEYSAVEGSEGAIYIVATALIEQLNSALNEPGAPTLTPEIIATFLGVRLDRVTFAHPFIEVDGKPREVLGVVADYVTTEQGTGAVHTAPAHGPDDFMTGQNYGLPLTCNVDAQGKLRNYEGFAFNELYVHKANAPIIELVRERGALMGRFDLDHKYPHCWRCHKPVIFRATEQWFIGMEAPMLSPKEGAHQTTFRQRALDEIKDVTWDPAWGEERISNMIATRPDWCISRQRIWGVPIAVFLCERCHEPLNDAAVNKSVVDLFMREGADAWYTRTPEQLLPADTACKNCGAVMNFRKEMDILDVWFESGASWHCVLEVEPELRFPADLYTEGGDQHRGWFHSSLLSAVGVRDTAPYMYVATSGWTLDEQGRAFSKSLGNGVDPVDVANRLGAEIIRLWVASVDFREDVAASENLMQRVSENYRKLRNTLRFLLSNLYDFTPATDSVPFPSMQPLDQYILARLAELSATIRKAYDEFEFHRAYQALNEFVNADLSALYLDVVKDRLYTFAPESAERRSAQTALWQIAETLTRLIAPILSFTADEVWQFLPHVDGRESSVHLALFPAADFAGAEQFASITNDWASLLNVREAVNIELEALRNAKAIGKGLEAAVELIVAEGTPHADVLMKHEASLAEFFNVSQVSVQAIGDTKQAAALLARAAPALGARCARCWRVVPDVGSDARWPEVCERCAHALEVIGYVPSNEKEQVA
jgi:isoleucyl-tRNA synthetase